MLFILLSYLLWTLFSLPIGQIGLLMMPSLRYCTPPSLTWTARMATMSMSFIDYSSAFNTIVPTKLAVKLSDLGLNTSLCDWIQDFLTARPQVVKVGQFTSNSITLNVGAPQGCFLSPLLYSLYTHTTACPLTAPLLLSSLRMILWFWASFPTMMRPHTWMRWRDSHHGSRTTVSL